jgi:hypothetical protein
MAAGLFVACTAAMAATNNVYSVNVMGYQRIAVPAHGLNIGAMPYQKSPSLISDVVGDQMTSGTAENPGKADSAYFYNTAEQVYETAYLYTDGTDYFWLDGKSQMPATNVILPGSGFWLRNAQDQEQNVYVVGDVLTAGAATNHVVSGLQLLSYPYSVPRDLDDLTLADGAVYGESLSDADAIYIWRPAQQQFQIAYFYSDGSLIDYATGNPVQCQLKPGQAFWYKHVGDGFDWVEVKPYASP